MSTFFCSTCNKDLPISNFTKSSIKICKHTCKECEKKSRKDFYKEKKIRYINLLGGKCLNCGYDKNYSALEFHHIDPKEKDFSWVDLKKMKDEIIVKEIYKCVLLCSNCHRELHNPELKIEFHFEDPLTTTENRNKIHETG